MVEGGTQAHGVVEEGTEAHGVVEGALKHMGWWHGVIRGEFRMASGISRAGEEDEPVLRRAGQWEDV